MSKIIKIYKNRYNRKKIFEVDDPRPWMNTLPEQHPKSPVAISELMRQRLTLPSKWDICSSGIVSIDGVQQLRSRQSSFSVIPRCDLDTVASTVLGSIECGVRETYQSFSRDCALAYCHPQAHGYGDDTFFCFEGLVRDTCAQPFRHVQRTGGVAIRGHDQEFLTAIAADGIIGANLGAQPLNGLSKHRVADQMPMSVIDGFEVINIGNGEAE